jgi:hypothetical protein
VPRKCPELQETVNNGLGETSYAVLVYTGSTKVGQQTVSMPAPGYTGTFDRRTRWPANGYYPAQFKYSYENELYDADGDSARTGVRINPSVHLYKVRFHNLSAGADSTSVSASVNEARVDYATATQATKTSSVIDGVYGDCGGTDLTQWRYDGTVTTGVSANCSDLLAVTNACPPAFECEEFNVSSCEDLEDCLEEYATVVCSAKTLAHVFYVEEGPCGNVGTTVTISSCGDGVPRNFFLLEEGVASSSTTHTTVLAHEFGHAFGDGHCNEDGEQADWCDPGDCTAGTSSENLMCSSGPGRVLNATQCDELENTLPLRFADQN